MNSFAYASVTSESFIIQIHNKSMSIVAPEKVRKKFAVIVENQSLSKQIGKFVSENQNLKYISVPPGKSETVEIENLSDKKVFYVPLSPAFQEVNLEFGKRAYEIPAKD